MGKRILVADDSRTIQQAFAMVMDGTGYTLSFARSVDEALAAARQDGRPDLVLSDVALGSGTGYDLCAQLKAEAALRDVPVYILASAQNPYDEARGRKVGADGYLAKPFESQALLDAVASALATPARRPAAAPVQGMGLGGLAGGYGEAEGAEDEDSYGEITIERGARAPASPAAWSGRPPTKPSGARPLPEVPTPAPPAQAVLRAPMIPGPRPAMATPGQRPGSTPQPMAGLPPSPAAPQMRPPTPGRTMMGFPLPKPGAAGRTTGFPATAAPPVAAPAAPAPSRPATVPPATMPGARPTGFPTPAAGVLSGGAWPASQGPAMPTPVPPPRPVVPRVTPVAPAFVTPPAPQALPVPRRTATQAPAAAYPPPVVAAVADKIDQKVAALAERGPEYEAIAKLSREIIEQVVWEVVPELAETIVRQAVDRLASAKK